MFEKVKWQFGNAQFFIHTYDFSSVLIQPYWKTAIASTWDFIMHDDVKWIKLKRDEGDGVGKEVKFCRKMGYSNTM